MSLLLKVLSAPWGWMGGANPHLQSKKKQSQNKKPCRATQRIISDIWAHSQWHPIGNDVSGIWNIYSGWTIYDHPRGCKEWKTGKACKDGARAGDNITYMGLTEEHSGLVIQVGTTSLVDQTGYFSCNLTWKKTRYAGSALRQNALQADCDSCRHVIRC